MSFKIKKWALLRNVKVTDEFPTLKSYRTPGQAGINTRGAAIPWQGKILVLCYDADDNPVSLMYDPAGGSWSGPSPAPTGLSNWSLYSYYYGWQRYFRYWGNQYVIGQAMAYDYGGHDIYFDASGACHWFGAPSGYTRTRYHIGLGIKGGEPARFVQSWNTGEGITYLGVSTPGGYSRVASGVSGVDFKQPTASNWGSTYFGVTPFEGHYNWPIQNGSIQKIIIMAGLPSPDQSPILEGSYSSGPGYGISLPDHGGLCKATPIGGTAFYTYAGSLEEVDYPWYSQWHYQQLRDGGPMLDEYDIDGSAHGVPYLPIEGGLSFLNTSLGWYVTIGSGGYSSPTNFNVYVLDPQQPAGRAKATWIPNAQAAGWMGEYAMGSDLVLGHILPFPDERAPQGGQTMPPQERSDGYVLGQKELYQRQGSRLAYVRGIKVGMSSYPTSDGNWWFPGSDGDHYDGFWHFFAGRGPTVIGRMPDYMFGMLSPVGTRVDRGLGLPAENLEALEPLATHELASSDLLADTVTWATPMTGTLSNQRAMLISSLSDDRFAYCETATRFQLPPHFRAVAGSIAGQAWTTLVDFGALGPPGLGESNWTVWSVSPIPVCRALPEGGWLVGATLYFDPWIESKWEWTVGARAHTFRNTGKGYVPALPTYDGPVAKDHEPILLSTYDEWTAHRALYGPDALLVYGLDGTFVECLNSEGLHAPDGREAFVVPGPIPRIVYRVYRHGVYSDYAEYYGQYHHLDENEEIQTPLFACYDLENAEGKIAPGAGTFRGFVDMYVVADYAAQTVDPETGIHWRWGSVAPTLYDYLYPKTLWAPSGSGYVRAGLGGRQPVLLVPGPPSVRQGVKGVGQRV